jgi:hypothetical protein
MHGLGFAGYWGWGNAVNFIRKPSDSLRWRVFGYKPAQGAAAETGFLRDWLFSKNLTNHQASFRF